MKEILWTTALMIALLSMLISGTYATSFGPYPDMTPYAYGNGWISSADNCMKQDLRAGTGFLSAISTNASWSTASLYFSTGWWTFTLLGASGSVYLNAGIADAIIYGTAYLRVDLFVLQYPDSKAYISQNEFFNALGIEAIDDGQRIGLGVDLGSLSVGPPTRYTAYGLVSVGAWGAGSFINVSLAVDQILFTPCAHWEPFTGPEIYANPMIKGMNEDELKLMGTGFAPASVVTVKATPRIPPETDDIDLWPIDFGGAKTDEKGDFELDAARSLDDGSYLLGAKDLDGNEAVTIFAVKTMIPPIITDINGDGIVNILDVAQVAKDFGYSWPPPELPTEETSLTTTNESASSSTTDNWAYTLFIPPVAIPSVIYFARRKRKIKPPRTD